LSSNKQKPLAVLCVGLGSVTTTFIAGVHAIRKGFAQPIGSLTQMERQKGNNNATIAEALELSPLDQLIFGAWDIRPDNAYEAALTANVLEKELIDSVKSELSDLQPMPGVFHAERVPNLHSSFIKSFDHRKQQAEALRQDIRDFMSSNNCERGVVVWCASTEIYHDRADCHQSLEAFEQAIENNDNNISPTQLYAWAALKEGLPFINGSPNSALELPALRELAQQEKIAIAGSDLKTGQTMMKTGVAPILRQRLLGVKGWFSTNILGNRDGEVLNHSGAFESKKRTKSGVLDGIFNAEEHPSLYGDLSHQVYIHYYPPRGDEKESWDNIDIIGWLGYPMQMKINFLCRDSILAAPVILDTVLLIDLAQRQQWYGLQEWLAFYFKAPEVANGNLPVHALGEQHRQLFDRLKPLMTKNA
jgi:myo-inositol-1-phosphate synthase